MKKNIDHIDRYYSQHAGYVHYVHYTNGDIDQYGDFKSLPDEAKKFIPQADFQFMRNKSGETFHRFS